MNIKAIVTSLVLGSSLGTSALAVASPGVTFSANAQAAYGSAVVQNPGYLHADTRGYYDAGDRTRAYGAGQDSDDCDPPVVQVSNRPDTSYWRDRRPTAMPPVYRPALLASDVHFGSDGRTPITVGGQVGRFDTLQITGASGRTFVKQVWVQFDNGQEQVVRNIDRTLVNGQSLRLDLDGNHRAIRRIMVYGNGIGGGWQRVGGTFTVTAA
jgi:hypothetical protein